MIYYTSIRLVDGKPRKVIVDETGKIVNRNPSKEELKCLEEEKYKQKRYGAKYIDKYLIECLKRFYKENGRIPKENEFLNNPEYPSFRSYQEHFGSWNNALTISGLGIRTRNKRYTDDELLNYLKQFYEKNGKVPAIIDFLYNPECPSIPTYQNRFGSWENSLKLVKMDLDTRVRQGYLGTNKEKGRLWEILVGDVFDNKHIDLSGENCNNYLDGICPNGQTYEVKSATLYNENGWHYNTSNKDKEEDKEAIQWWYFGAFNSDYTKLLYVWRVPGEIVENKKFYVGMGTKYAKFHIYNMKEYDITDKFKKLLDNRYI